MKFGKIKLAWKSILGWKPKTKVGWFILICLAIYAVSGLTSDILSDYNEINGKLKEANEVLRVLSFVSLACAFGAMIVFGIRNIRAEGFLKRKMVMPVLGAAVCLVLAFSAWSLNTALSNIIGKICTDTESTVSAGRQEPYEPNEGTRKLRAEMEGTKYFFREMQKEAEIKMYIWATVAMLGVILGLITPVRKKEWIPAKDMRE